LTGLGHAGIISARAGPAPAISLSAFLKDILGMLRSFLVSNLGIALLALLASGCQSPYHADRGALFGGLTGAGAGAIVGNAVGNTGAGAVIGAGLGSLTGAAVGNSLDQIEARNRAEIAATLGQQVKQGAVSMQDVIAMSHSKVSDRLIVTHIQHNGVAQTLTSGDLIFLKEQGVSDEVIQAMQSPPPRPQASPRGTPVIVEEHHYGPPPYYYRPHHYHYRHHRHHHRPSFGFSISN
jgi:hypothetical protein